jgi:hypothetical protein
MKRIILAATSAIALAATAGAASANETATVNINAEVASKCGISATSSLITLDELTGADAKVRSNVTEEIATKLSQAKIIPFCNKAGSEVKVERAVLARVGATGNQPTTGGYAQFVRYNLDTSINGLALDSTSVAGSSTVAQPFGGHVSSGDVNTHIKFTKAAADGTAVASSNGSSAVAVNWSSLTDRRLIAGSYTGYVTIELTPGA